jgi:hypothetical protein
MPQRLLKQRLQARDARGYDPNTDLNPRPENIIVQIPKKVGAEAVVFDEDEFYYGGSACNDPERHEYADDNLFAKWAPDVLEEGEGNEGEDDVKGDEYYLRGQRRATRDENTNLMWKL